MAKKTIATLVGARPQIIKSAALTRFLKSEYQEKIEEVVIHTGQHYDKELSDNQFRDLELSEPSFYLSAGSGSHAVQTALMLERAEEAIQHIAPECLIVYGDTNSTLAGALSAAKLNIPVIHIEAGLRSFNKTMPEEINRIVCDHVSTFLFTPTQTGFDNLLSEGFNNNNGQEISPDNPAIF
ncbi:MAG: UDP-N-acetyl glucosamine 2-epimerase, partial [Bacteroidales bacterium]|nr:UDP-N-acetyl glucosamine 2-epimerase [Bacteroidales bacterium]